MKTKILSLCAFVALVTTIIISGASVYAQTRFGTGAAALPGQVFGPQNSQAVPGPNVPPGTPSVSPFPSGGFPSSGTATSPFGATYPSGYSSNLPGSFSSPSTLPGTPTTGAPITSFGSTSPGRTGSGTYSPSFSYPGLSGMSGTTGLFGPQPGSMGTGTVGSTAPGSMLGSQAGVYGYPAGVPGTPLG